MGLYQKTKAKNIISDKEVLNKTVADTIHRMANIVGSTLGPGGRGVLIERDGLSPLVTKDGVTVVRSLGVANAEANIITEAAKEIAINTAKEAGDGTTTAIVIADAIIKYGQEFISSKPKYNPQKLISELQDVYDKVIVEYLKKNAIPADNEDQLRSVAKISANGDNNIADAVVKAVMAAGDDGTVLLEEAQGNQMTVDTIDGYVVTSGLKDLGPLGPVFINEKANQQAAMDNCIIFLYDGKMNDLQIPSKMQDMIESLELFGYPILVFAHSFSDTVIDRFVRTVKGGIMVVPIKTPMTGLPNGRSMFLHDMAAYTGGFVHDPTTIETIGELKDDEVFGCADTVRVNRYETVIQCSPDAAKIDERVNELKTIAKDAFGELDKMHLRAAIGKLSGGISTIWVGGTSELEIREKKARVEDAVEAVRSAIAEGVVPGGCSVHNRLADIIDSHPDRKESWGLLSKALRVPFSLLMTNCGEDLDDIDTIRTSIALTSKKQDVLPDKVFDAAEHNIVEPFAAGIIEPAKVCRVSIGNAISVASLLITLGGIVVVPRDAGLENQLALADQTFRSMISEGT